jgi:hypothetical protein
MTFGESGLSTEAREAARLINEATDAACSYLILQPSERRKNSAFTA